MLASTSNLDKYYQLLGICREASIDELKTAYRSLARQWHPDLNPGNTDAHQRFLTIDRAYRILLDKIALSVDRQPLPAVATAESIHHKSELKWQLYYELQLLLKQQQFLKAIVLIEGLAQNAPHDRQICQWQGIIYSQYGYQLVKKREFDKAKIYLKKALKVDPNNRQLGEEVERAFNRLALVS